MRVWCVVALIGAPPTKSYSFTGCDVYRVAERCIEFTTVYDTAIGGSPQGT